MSKSLTIGQVATATGIPAHTLRYYEQAGLLRAVGRTAAGHRLYAPADLEWLQFVMRLKATGMPIASIKAFSELRALGQPTYGERRAMLVVHRDTVLAQIAELQANLTAITDKIAWYETAERDLLRHDDRYPPTPQEKDTSWTSDSTPRPRRQTATRGAGKS